MYSILILLFTRKNKPFEKKVFLLKNTFLKTQLFKNMDHYFY